jgi:hypothetical protein
MRIKMMIMATQTHPTLLAILQFSITSGDGGFGPFGFALALAVEFDAVEVEFPALVVEFPEGKVELVPRKGTVSFEAASTSAQ